MRQSSEPLPNFTHFQREDGLGDFFVALFLLYGQCIQRNA